MVPSHSLPRALGPLLFILLCGCSIVAIWVMWFGMNSDGDNVHPLLTQLIPAGHCTCQTSTSFQCADCLACHESLNTSQGSTWTFEYGRDDRRLDLTRDQCHVSFPGLFEDIRRAVSYWEPRGVFTTDLDAVPLRDGMARVIIQDGELYVVATRAKNHDHRQKILATLASIYRALSTSPERKSLKNIELIFSIEDRVDDVGVDGYPVWVLSRRASEESVWLMPDFGYWSWGHKPNNDLGPYEQAVDRAVGSEAGLDFMNKQAKLVWRGKLSFAPKLRRTLLDVTRNKPWGDVKEVNWRAQSNYLAMQDHCKYMFIGHIEGRAYSASLKYRQACHSVVVAHKLQFIQHHHYLLVSSGAQQNYLEVERDFSDLPEKMDELLQNPARAKQIADNNIKTFRERYLTQAAEACYWRQLWDGWSSVFIPSDQHASERGLRYESFLLLDSEQMLRCTFNSN